MGSPGRPFGFERLFQCGSRFLFFAHEFVRERATHECRPTPVQVTHISRVGGSLQIRKEDVRAAVFKPTVALPTMSVEEFGEIELERARLQQVRYEEAERTVVPFSRRGGVLMRGMATRAGNPFVLNIMAQHLLRDLLCRRLKRILLRPGDDMTNW